MLLWEEWRETHPDGMSYPTWCRRFREWRPRRDATMRQNRRPGERLFVDYAGMTVPLLVDGKEHEAQVFVASMGVSGRLYAEATLSQKIDDWCASHVRCFEDMGWAPQVVVPDNIKAAVKDPSRYEPVLNETYADLLDHYGVQGFPARVRRPRDKGAVEQGVLHVERRVLAPLRKHVFHDLASLNRAIAEPGPEAQRQALCRRHRRDPLRPVREHRSSAHAAAAGAALAAHGVAQEHGPPRLPHRDRLRHFYSVPYQYIGKEVDVRLRGQVIDVFHRGRQIASHLRSHGRGRATTLKEHQPVAKHQRAGVEDTRDQPGAEGARNIGPHVLAFVTAIMERNPNPEFGFRSCYGVLRLANGHEPDRFDAACRYAMELGSRKTYRGLDNILRTGADLADAPEPETAPIDHPNIRGPEYYR